MIKKNSYHRKHVPLAFQIVPCNSSLHPLSPSNFHNWLYFLHGLFLLQGFKEFCQVKHLISLKLGTNRHDFSGLRYVGFNQELWNIIATCFMDPLIFQCSLWHTAIMCCIVLHSIFALLRFQLQPFVLLYSINSIHTEEHTLSSHQHVLHRQPRGHDLKFTPIKKWLHVTPGFLWSQKSHEIWKLIIHANSGVVIHNRSRTITVWILEKKSWNFQMASTHTSDLICSWQYFATKLHST